MITFEKYSKFIVDNIPNDHLAFLDINDINKNIKPDFETITQRMVDTKFAEHYYSSVKIKHTVVQDYFYQQINLNGYIFIASIRFKNLDINTPFVQLEYFSCGLEEVISIINSLTEAIKVRFCKFKPKHIRFFTDSDKLSSIPKALFEIDQYVYATPVVKLPIIDLPDGLSVEMTGEINESDYIIYENQYDLFHRLNPELKNIKPLKRNLLNDLASSNGVYKIRYLGNWIGLTCLEDSNESYIYGLYVAEQIIFPEYSQQSYSSLAQLYIVKHFYSHKSGLFYGVIDANNAYSLKSAIKTGRKIFAAYITISL